MTNEEIIEKLKREITGFKEGLMIKKEIALYKVSTNQLKNGSAENIAKENNAKVLFSSPSYFTFR